MATGLTRLYMSHPLADVICIEDIINQIVTCGPHFTAVNRFLWVFKLSPPTGGMAKKGKKISFREGGDYGNREEAMIPLVHSMV